MPEEQTPYPYSGYSKADARTPGYTSIPFTPFQFKSPAVGIGQYEKDVEDFLKARGIRDEDIPEFREALRIPGKSDFIHEADWNRRVSDLMAPRLSKSGSFERARQMQDEDAEREFDLKKQLQQQTLGSQEKIQESQAAALREQALAQAEAQRQVADITSGRQLEGMLGSSQIQADASRFASQKSYDLGMAQDATTRARDFMDNYVKQIAEATKSIDTASRRTSFR